MAAGQTRMPKDTPASELLAEAIEAAGGQAQLAARLGVTQQSVGHWRRRGQAPAARTAALESIGPAAPPRARPAEAPTATKDWPGSGRSTLQLE